MLDKYQDLLKELKKKSRCNAIYNWHLETLKQMKVNLNLIRR